MAAAHLKRVYTAAGVLLRVHLTMLRFDSVRPSVLVTVKLYSNNNHSSLHTQTMYGFFCVARDPATCVSASCVALSPGPFSFPVCIYVSFIIIIIKLFKGIHKRHVPVQGDTLTVTKIQLQKQNNIHNTSTELNNHIKIN